MLRHSAFKLDACVKPPSAYEVVWSISHRVAGSSHPGAPEDPPGTNGMALPDGRSGSRARHLPALRVHLR